MDCHPFVAIRLYGSKLQHCCKGSRVNSWPMFKIGL